jgi:hypothetical protein
VNDLFYIFYEARLMLLDTADMSCAGERAHRRLCDYTWSNDGPPLNLNDGLRQISNTSLAEWPAVKKELLRKGWIERGDFFLHRRVVRTLNDSKLKFVEGFNRTCKANGKKPMTLSAPDNVTGVSMLHDPNKPHLADVTLRVTPPVTDGVTEGQSKSNTGTGIKDCTRQSNQTPNTKHQTPNGKVPLTKLTVERVACDRIAGEITANRFHWAYDNCKVQPSDFPHRKSLATVLEAYAGRVTEAHAHAAWREAVSRTHKAVVDGLKVGSVPGYCIACWREAMGKESEHGVHPLGCPENPKLKTTDTLKGGHQT